MPRRTVLGRGQGTPAVSLAHTKGRYHMMARQRRRASSSHPSGPPEDQRRHRLRAAVAGVFSLALVVFTLSGAAPASALSSQQAASAGSAQPVVGSLTTDQTTNPL